MSEDNPVGNPPPVPQTHASEAQSPQAQSSEGLSPQALAARAVASNPEAGLASKQATEQATEQARKQAHSRRAFLFKLSLILNGAVGAVLAVPILGYLLAPAMKRRSDYNSWITLGSLDQFPEGETRLANYRNPVTTPWDGQTGDVPCWVRRIAGTDFQVFAINCAHLGCPVRWFAQSKLFMCPCHGGAYYEDGSRASGPPERGLFEYQHKVSGNNLMISAGQMPTLATRASVEQPLVQIGSQVRDCPGRSQRKTGGSSWES